MTHYQIICEAYDKCGILYATWTEEDDQFIVLVASLAEKQLVEMAKEIPCYSPFMEFYNGSIASY